MWNRISNCWILFAIFAMMVQGCKDHSTESVAGDPYARWKSHQVHNYTFDQLRSCFCAYGGEKMRITVRSDSVVRVVRISDGTVLTEPSSNGYLPVDSLFGIITKRSGDSLVIEYDPELGYPSKLDINPQLHPVDGGVLIESSNLTIQ